MAERRSGYEQLRSFAEKLRQSLPQLRSLVENPRLLGAVIEEKSPWVSRHFLSAASNLTDPFLAGMGLEVTEFSENRACVRLPNRWKNRSEGGAVHVGALATVAEFTSRLLWSRHLDPQLTELRAVRMESEFLKTTNDDVRAVMTLAEAEREDLLYRLRADGFLEAESLVSVYDSREQLVARVTVVWSLKRPQVLGPGRS